MNSGSVIVFGAFPFLNSICVITVDRLWW